MYKFETRGDKVIFLGYSQNSRAYRVYNLRTKTLVKSINMVVSDINVESKIKGLTIVDESENTLTYDSPEIDDSLPTKTPEVPNWVSEHHPFDGVVGNPTKPVRTRSQLHTLAHFACFVSLIETKNINQALNDPLWISSM